MPVKKQNIGSKKPALQGDLEDLREDIHLDIAGTEQRINANTDSKIESAEGSIKSELRQEIQEAKDEILTALTNSVDRIIDKQIEHDARITKLEERV